jgi:hypothetical protein
MVTSLVGMVFTPACALALKGGQRPVGRRRGLQAQGPVGEGLVAIDLPAVVHAGTAKSALWCSPTPNTSRPTVSPVWRSRRCRSAAATARYGGRWRGRDRRLRRACGCGHALHRRRVPTTADGAHSGSSIRSQGFPSDALPAALRSAAAGRGVINLSVRTPDQLLTLVPSARTSDRRSTALWPAPPRQPNRSRPRGRHLLRPARGSGG